jgi:hypothetical protein
MPKSSRPASGPKRKPLAPSRIARALVEISAQLEAHAIALAHIQGYLETVQEQLRLLLRKEN